MASLSLNVSDQILMVIRLAAYKKGGWDVHSTVGRFLSIVPCNGLCHAGFARLLFGREETFVFGLLTQTL
jgi:hypothetical protein